MRITSINQLGLLAASACLAACTGSNGSGVPSNGTPINSQFASGSGGDCVPSTDVTCPDSGGGHGDAGNHGPPGDAGGKDDGQAKGPPASSDAGDSGSADGCFFTGGGAITLAKGTDTFGGEGKSMPDGSVSGQWENLDHVSGGDLHGQVQYLVCRHVTESGPGQPSGPSHNFDMNQAYFGGPATLSTGNASLGAFWFDVFAEDHGEPGSQADGGNNAGGGPDFYHVTIRQMTGASSSGVVVFDASGNIVGGNLQIHPPNDGHPMSTSSLPSWVVLQP